MIELRLLGLHSVRGDDGHEIGSLPAQPKRFALLAYLAIGAGGGYHRRDALAAMFWPDLDQFAARRALRNTLYHLRDALGDEVIVTQGDDAVAIDPSLLTSDATLLAEAVADGRFEDAVNYFRGDLLDGVHFASAGEQFESWLSRERTRITEVVMRALRGLVDREEGAGNFTGAASWAQRASALAPGDETWLRRAMGLLDDAGDRAGALRLHDAFTRRLAADFGATTSADTEALAVSIREGRRTRARPPAQAPEADPKIREDRATPTATAPRPRTRRLVRWALGAGAVAAGGILVARAITPSHAHAPPARTRVLVAVFDNRTGDARLQSLGRMAEDWVAQGIVRMPLAEVVDSRVMFVQRGSTEAPVDPVAVGRRNGAAMVVSGSYYLQGDSLLFQAQVTDARNGRIVRVAGPIATSVAKPVAALDELRSRVMTALASAVDMPMVQELDRSGEIPPFDAYQSYVGGWDAFWHGEGRRATQLFLDAARRDTAFIAAAVAAAMAASNSNDCPVIDSLDHALTARRRPLDHVDRLSMQIAVARCHGRNDEMLRLALERADAAPRTSSFLFPAASAALWANRPARALAILRRIDPTVDLGWNTDSTHFGYWSYLTESLHLLGRHEEELAAARRFTPAAPLGGAWMRARALAAMSRSADALALVDTMVTLPVETSSATGLAPFSDGRPQYAATPAWMAIWIARELFVHGDSASARQAAARALAWYRARPPDERATPEERLVAAWSYELSGNLTDAEHVMRILIAEDPANVDYRGELAGVAAERGERALCDSLDQWLAGQPVARVSWSASFYRARDAALLGRAADAVALAREALEEGAWPMYLHNDVALAPLRTRPDLAALMAPKS